MTHVASIWNTITIGVDSVIATGAFIISMTEGPDDVLTVLWLARQAGLVEDGQVPLDLEFVDEAGNTVRLGETFDGKPVILTLVYYECPMLCTLVLNGMVEALANVEFAPGEEFVILSVTIDPSETWSAVNHTSSRHRSSNSRPSLLSPAPLGSMLWNTGTRLQNSSL